MRTIFRQFCLLVAVLAVVCWFCADVQACPTCKDGLVENDPATQSMAAGYYYSILFMMSMPFVIIGTFGSAAYFSIRKARASELEQSQALSKP